MESSIDLFSCTYPLPRPQGAGAGSGHLARGGAAVLMPKQARGATRAPPGSTRKKWSPRAISAQLVPVRVQLISTSLLALSSTSAFAGLCSSLPPAAAFTISCFTKLCASARGHGGRGSKALLRPRLALRNIAWPKRRIAGRRHSAPAHSASEPWLWGVKKTHNYRGRCGFTGFQRSAASWGLSFDGGAPGSGAPPALATALLQHSVTS
jgi:hypothetical protein